MCPVRSNVKLAAFKSINLLYVKCYWCPKLNYYERQRSMYSLFIIGLTSKQISWFKASKMHFAAKLSKTFQNSMHYSSPLFLHNTLVHANEFLNLCIIIISFKFEWYFHQNMVLKISPLLQNTCILKLFFMYFFNNTCACLKITISTDLLQRNWKTYCNYCKN